MRQPGPTPDTTVAHVDYDGGRYLVVFNSDDEAIKVSYRLMRNHAFYGWRGFWEEGEPLNPKARLIIGLAVEAESQGAG